MKYKIISFVVAVVFLGAALADFVYLRGEKVYSSHGKLINETLVNVPINDTGVLHRLVISTGRSKREDYQIALSWSFKSPDGTVLYSDNEIAAYSNRSFEFIPEESGDYILSMSPNYSTAGFLNRLDQEDRYRVSILLNDRSILFPIIQSIPF
jgi:hypothetical protein